MQDVRTCALVVDGYAFAFETHRSDRALGAATERVSKMIKEKTGAVTCDVVKRVLLFPEVPERRGTPDAGGFAAWIDYGPYLQRAQRAGWQVVRVPPQNGKTARVAPAYVVDREAWAVRATDLVVIGNTAPRSVPPGTTSWRVRA